MLASAGVSALFTSRYQHAIHGHQLTIRVEPGSVAAEAEVLDLVGLKYTTQPADSR